MSHAPTVLKVAAVQFRSGERIEENLARIREHLARLAGEGVRLAVFPECAATGYDGTVIASTSEEELRQAEATVAAACRESDTHAVVGIPYFEGGKRYNGALAWDPAGRCIARYAKIQLAGEAWCVPGERFALFRVDGVVCSIIVCHDERYPELVRLPVLAGAQVVCYLSCESSLLEESKIGPYRAQIQARAEENSVYIVHSNAPMGTVSLQDGALKAAPGTSHGQSRIIRPDGNLIAEASMFGEDVLVAELDVRAATRHLAERSRQSPLLKAWWEAGLALVPPVS